MKKFSRDEHSRQHSERRWEVDDHLVDTTLSGTLFFDGETPCVKTPRGMVVFHMPDFFRFAYFEGIRPDVQVKVRGQVRHPGAEGGHPVMHANEVTVGTKTFLGHAGPLNLPVRPPSRLEKFRDAVGIVSSFTREELD